MLVTWGQADHVGDLRTGWSCWYLRPGWSCWWPEARLIILVTWGQADQLGDLRPSWSCWWPEARLIMLVTWGQADHVSDLRPDWSCLWPKPWTSSAQCKHLRNPSELFNPIISSGIVFCSSHLIKTVFCRWCLKTLIWCPDCIWQKGNNYEC